MLRPGHHLLGGLLGLPLYHAHLLLPGGDLQNPRLELEGAVLVDRQDGGLGAHLHQLHRVARPGWPGGRRGRLLRPGPQLPLRLVEAAAQGGPLVVDPLPVFLFPLAAAHVVELLEYLVGGVPGLVQNGPGLRLGLLHRLGPLGLHLGLVLPGGLGRLLHLPPEPGGGLLLPLHLLRCSSSWVSTSSKRTFSASMRAAAFWMIDLGRPRRSEMAKALDLPGMPMSRR